MRRQLATLAAIGLTTMLGTAAYAADDGSGVNNDNNITNDLAPSLSDLNNFPKLGPKTSILDLGIDVSNVELTPQGVGAFLASLDPQAQGVLITTCNHYLTTPNAAQAYTLQFCGILVGG